MVRKRRKFDAACYKKAVSAGRSPADAMTLCSAKRTVKKVAKTVLDVAMMMPPGGFIIGSPKAMKNKKKK